mgnify:CR=1 FL=1|tara:strand:+ start:12115 stop:12834 length:720 start_codon:yes stop_codon:yes gene_type:complete
MKENIDKILFKLLILGTALIIIFGAVDQFIGENNIFKIDKVIISGCNLIELESIENQFSFIKDKNIFSLNIDDIELKLENYDFIESAKLIKVYPSTVIIDIIEISPIGIYKYNNNNLLVDSNSNGFLCSSSISSSIHVPEIKIQEEINFENIFNTYQYKTIKQIHETNPKLFYQIKSISDINDEILVNTQMSKILFNKAHYILQINHLNKLLMHSDEYQNFNYIKFSHLDIVVNERGSI